MARFIYINRRAEREFLQFSPAPAAIRELRQSGLTVGDIARVFRVRPRTVETLLGRHGDGEKGVKHAIL